MKKLLTIALILCTLTSSAQMRGGSQFDPGAARTSLNNVDAAATPSITSITLSDKIRAVWADILGDIYASGTVKVATGTAATPAYSFSSDPDTGIYSPGANTIGFGVNATHSVSIDEGGIDVRRNYRIGWVSQDTFNYLGVTTAQNGMTYGPSVKDRVTLSGYYGLTLMAGSNLALTIPGDTRNVLIATSTDDGSNKLQVVGNAWFSADVSALSFTDRTPAPENLAQAYAIVDSHKVKDGEIDHTALHPAAWGKKIRRNTTGRLVEKKGLKGEKQLVPEIEEIEEPDQSKRNLSVVITAQALVIQDLIKRIEKLE